MTTLLEESDDLIRALRATSGEPTPPTAAPSAIHTVYVGAHRFNASTIEEHGDQARAYFSEYAGDPKTLAAALNWPNDATTRLVHQRVERRLALVPVEDMRIDFEDGYGVRPNDEEDADAERAGLVAASLKPSAPRLGIRVKPLVGPGIERAVGTLDRFMTASAAGVSRPRLVVTVPKVTFAHQLSTMDALLGRLERRLGWDESTIELEFMVEVPSALFDDSGRLNLARFMRAAGSRLRGVHLGVYDFTTAYGVSPGAAELEHPACDFARSLMAITYAETGLVVSAGSTNVLPRVEPTAPLRARRAAVHAAWRRSSRALAHALRRGYYHGWDLHPGQIPVRLAVFYRFFLDQLEAASTRLRSFLAAAIPATEDASVLDDAATGQALLSFFVRGYGCGAVTEHELAEAGLGPRDIAVGSFAGLIADRTG